MAFAADVGDDLEAVREAHLGDLTESGVRLLRRRRVDARADAALLRAVLKGRALALVVRELTRLANQLIDSRHVVRLKRSVERSE